MKVITDTVEMRAWSSQARCEEHRVGLVPTMGSLHAGHLALIREAHQCADRVVVTVFVNPAQFGPAEDFGRYPRALDEDLDKMQVAGGVDVVFVPDEAQIYPIGAAGQQTWVKMDRMADVLCGAFRPGHFDAVATVVAKLFNICRPQVAVFGKKDAQQYVILRRMASELDFDTEIVGVDTVREPDGLALSSRNVYLGEDERRQATALYQAVSVARSEIEGGERDPSVIITKMSEEIRRAPLARAEYVSVVDGDDLSSLDVLSSGDSALAALAVHFGATRLIDNAFVDVP